ncbi:MAG: gluconokinase [Chloroflexota bacterium]|nr:gluconokinase [Chloroflexota bacterium]
MEPASPREPFVLALDIGTSSARTALYDVEGNAVPGTLASSKHRPETTPDGGSELDPDALVERVCELLDRTLGASQGVTIAAVGTCTFWHSLVGVGADGSATTPIYTWADTRSAGSIERLGWLLDLSELYERTGCPPHPSFVPEKLLWLRESQPEVFRRTRRWMSPGEYVHLRLLGETRCAHAMASATGLYDQARQTWYEPVLKAVGVEPGELSRLAPVSQPAGTLTREYAARWPALSEVPWYPAVGDGAASNLGSGAAEPGVAALNFGTSGAIRTVVPEPVRFPRGLWLYRLDEHRLLLGGALSNAGNVYSWLLRTLGLTTEEAEETLWSSRPGTTGLRFVPHLAGERSPEWRPEATGAVYGLRLDTSRQELLQAGMEGVLLDFLTVHNMLVTAAGELTSLVASGGAISQSAAMRQALTNALGRPLQVCLEEEPSARGAALLALESLHAIPSVTDVRTDKTPPHQPDPERHQAYMALQAKVRTG